MNFGDRLIELRKERGFANRNDFANYIGMPSTTLRNYETNVREPGHIFLKQMADIFHVSIDYLLCITDDRTPHAKQSLISSEELSHLKKYRDLDDHGKEMVDLVLDKEHARMTSAKVIPLSRPVLNAAQERTDIEVTDEMRKHDNDLMKNDKLWE